MEKRLLEAQYQLEAIALELRDYAEGVAIDPQRLEEKRQAYLRLSERLRNAVVIDATRDPLAVEAEAISMLWARLGQGSASRER